VDDKFQKFSLGAISDKLDVSKYVEKTILVYYVAMQIVWSFGGS